MIDFRHFLISIVAVFLALGIGIVMGSGVLGGPILRGLERRADTVLQRNNSLRSQIGDLETERSRAEAFFDVTEPTLVRGELLDHPVVMVEPEGTDGAIGDSVERVVVEAGGEVVTRIVLSNRLSLEDESDVSELAGILESDTEIPRVLRTEAGTELGNRLGAAATEKSPRSGVARATVAELLTDLEDRGFASVERAEDQPIVPVDADLVVAAGDVDPAPYDVASLLGRLGRRAAVLGMPVAVTETSDSTWGVVPAVRNDPEVADQVSTIDDGETFYGRVALVGSLSGADGAVGHWGTDDGAEAIVPTPPP